jgi:hypothetical protein
MLLSIGSSVACWWAAGTTLGLFFGGLMVVTFLVPPAVSQDQSIRWMSLGFACAIVPVLLAWLGAVLKGADPLLQWVDSMLVLIAYSFAIAMIARLLIEIRVPPVVASAVAVVLGLAWLTWPIWLSETMLNRGLSSLAGHLVSFSPPLVINGILTGEPAWTERSIAYHLTNLNQDIPISFPTSAWPCALAHVCVAAVLAVIALLLRRGRKTPASGRG